MQHGIKAEALNDTGGPRARSNLSIGLQLATKGMQFWALCIKPVLRVKKEQRTSISTPHTAPLVVMQHYSPTQAPEHAGKQIKTTKDGSHVEEEDSPSISTVLLPVKDADGSLHPHPNPNSCH